MAGFDDLRQENAALRERIAKLSDAVLRVSASLDLDTVLREVVDSARALTGARYGMIATVDSAGEIEEFIAPGLTDDERRRMGQWPHGQAFYEHLRDLPGPLRVADVSAYARSLGYTEELTLANTLQATPMRHRGEHVGHFFLGEKAGGEAFTDEDEEVLVLFASQAATAIANARTHRDERRARADLEALVDTTPVGVVVFDAGSGRAVSFNREARRLVEGLRTPGQPPEQLLEVLTCRRSDGREVALGEVPLALALGTGETVRAEEIELSVPDGRSLTTLLNATPILSADGTVETVVVTMQDLAPLDELDRLRVEFLGMVSHELRAPLAAVKGSAATVLGAGPELDPAEMRAFFRVIEVQADHMRGLIGDLLDVGRIEAGTLSVSPEICEVAALVDRARNTFLAGGARHTMTIDLPPDLPPVMADRRRIVQVLNNLLANAARHAPESTPIQIAAERDGVHVAVTVSDEGRGVAPERLPHLFRKHTGVTGGSAGGALGAVGLGLAICKGLVEAHGGRIRAASGGPGQGTQITFTVPVAGEPGEEATPGRGADRRAVSRDWSGADPDPRGRRRSEGAAVRARRARGHRVRPGGDGRSGRALPGLIRSENPRLVLLDLMLPGNDGIEMMERVPELADLPIIFISAYGRDETVVRALDAGAADYIVKPFSPTELVARVRAALRKEAAPEPYVLGGLAIHYEQRRVSVAGRDVVLTATEYELLRVLSRNKGQGGERRVAAAPGVGRAPRGRHRACAHLREEAAAQARRQRGEAFLHRQRARCWLPHGPARRALLTPANVTPLAVVAIRPNIRLVSDLVSERLSHRAAHDVLRGEQLDLAPLAASLCVECFAHRSVGVGERPRAVHGGR